MAFLAFSVEELYAVAQSEAQRSTIVSLDAKPDDAEDVELSA
jgi:hypothetical protein